MTENKKDRIEDKEVAEVQEKAPKAKAKASTKAPEPVVATPVQYIHIDEFIELAKMIYPNDMDAMRCAGFKAYVYPKQMFKNELELKEKLDKYLNK